MGTPPPEAAESRAPAEAEPTAPGHEHARERLDRARDPGRVLALTDGIFAIIMTLLVLDIRVPTLRPGESLAHALGHVWPNLVVFAISFVVAGLYWMGHRDLFLLVKGVDRNLIWLNILYLLPVSLIPFAAALLSAYSQDALALRLYGALFALIAVMRGAVWRYVVARPHLLHAPLGRRAQRLGISTMLAPTIPYVVAMLLATVAPRVSLGIYAALPVLYFVGITFLRRLAPKGSPEQQFT